MNIALDQTGADFRTWVNKNYYKIIDTTYSNLLTMLDEGTLSQFQLYRITDYATKYIFSISYEYQINDPQTAIPEPLIVMAITNDSLSKVAYSETHPEDIIYYDWNNENWWFDHSYSVVDWSTYNIAYSDWSSGGEIGAAPELIDYSTLLTGLTGIIEYRSDITTNISGYFDWRNVKHRRWEADVTTWIAGTFILNSIVSYQESLYMCVVDSTTSTPGTDAEWASLYIPSNNLYMMPNDDRNIANGFLNYNSLVYQDFTTFQNYGEDIQDYDGNWITKFKTNFNNIILEKGYYSNVSNVVIFGNHCKDVILKESSCTLFGEIENSDIFCNNSVLSYYKNNKNILIEDSLCYGLYNNNNIRFSRCSMAGIEEITGGYIESCLLFNCNSIVNVGQINSTTRNISNNIFLAGVPVVPIL